MYINMLFLSPYVKILETVPTYPHDHWCISIITAYIHTILCQPIPLGMDLGFRLQHFGMEISDMNQPHTIHYWDLVGGFSPSEKYESQWGWDYPIYYGK